MRRWLWLSLLLLAAACDGQRPLLGAGDPAPDFELPRLEGESVRLSALHGRGVVAVRFWADWCPFCAPEMRALEPVYQRRKDKLAILAVNVAQERDTVARFVRRQRIGYPVLLDGDSAVARAYGVIALPVTYFVDSAGSICAKILGESDAATFERQVDRCLAGTDGR